MRHVELEYPVADVVEKVHAVENDSTTAKGRECKRKDRRRNNTD